MARYNHPQTDSTYAAAQRWVDAALKSDDSLFTPGEAVWSPAVMDDLCERFVQHPDLSSDDFLTKFNRQLAGDDPADPATVQLAGELLFIHQPPDKSEKKGAAGNQIAKASPEQLPLCGRSAGKIAAQIDLTITFSVPALLEVQR